LKKISLYLKKYRFINDISQKELSKKIGISQNHLSQIENNVRSPSISVMLKISKILKTCPYLLMDLCYECYENQHCKYKNNFFG
jgi:transcriptional regulator with XRE-family HTH domain